MNNYKNLIFNEFNCDIWHTLKNNSLPILIYGMGNGADKIIAAFDKYGIEYSDVFASDGFVRGHLYRGKRVLSYSEACEKYNNKFDIVVSFGTKLPEVMDRIFSLEKSHNVYAPDVPVCEGELFNEEFFDLHIDELLEAKNSLFDEKSKEIFDNVIRFKLSGRLCYLRATATKEAEVDSVLRLEQYKTYVDLGAYNGDTIKKYSALCPNLKEIYAFEPDKRNYKKLSSYCESLNIATYPMNVAAYSIDTTLAFSASANRNSSAASVGSFEHKKVLVEAKALDSVCKSADFIKYDVEGLEYDALLGSQKLIKHCSADLLVSMYHKSEDMYRLPLLVKSLNPEYSLILRRLPYIPAWDLNLYAIKKA